MKNQPCLRTSVECVHVAYALATGAGVSADVEYARNRLVRGLASSKFNARQSFLVTLTSVLKHIDAVTPQSIYLCESHYCYRLCSYSLQKTERSHSCSELRQAR